ncbi:hypothetical protein Clacol_007113 [Clathrus columnatus]|uniref:Uncharacterized protein n=1 Tax=Clathrus columnatus TaxID=1419009 RepID=A0AAV5AGV1_9AGAM|nr:hypothetical protein Clacol_007113 [Clathrus columnatus]
MDSPTSDTPRQSLLAFLSRPSRPRTHTHAQAQANLNEQQLPPPSSQQQQPQLQPPPPNSSAAVALLPSQSQTLPTNARRQGVNSGLATPSMQTGSFGNMLRRRRSANNVDRNAANPEALRRGQDNNQSLPTSNNNNGNNGGANGACVNVTNTNGGVPHLESLRSLNFEPLSRDVRQGDSPLRIGRFTEHSSAQHTSNKLAFKSKVVSRGHAEVWFDNGSDTKSSSGTFLNHIRLSPPNTESRPFPIKDGDVLQLGVDYQGGTEEMYRCVKLRIELGREWQTGVNAFNLQALQQLKNLSNPAAAVNASANGEGSSRAAATATQTQTRTTTPRPTQGQGQSQTQQANTGTLKPSRSNSKAVRPKAAAKQPLHSSSTLAASNSGSTNNTTAVSDCCICLSSVTILQALFIAPCSHAYHYKCIRPLLERHHPGFSCPLCRTFADLEADVEGDSIGVTTLLAGNGGQEDQMVIDEEYEDDVILEEIYDGGGEEDGENGSAEDQGQGQGRRRRRNGIPSEGELDGDAGAETDAAPEILGPAGMGGFANIASTGSGQGFIHDPNIDVDPSAPALRLPLREDEDAAHNALSAGNMTLSPTFYDNIDSPTAANGGTLVNPPPSAAAATAPGGSVIRQQTQTPQIPPVRFNPLIIEDGDEGTSENSEGGNVAVMRTAIHTLHKR